MLCPAYAILVSIWSNGISNARTSSATLLVSGVVHSSFKYNQWHNSFCGQGSQYWSPRWKLPPWRQSHKDILERTYCRGNSNASANNRLISFSDFFQLERHLDTRMKLNAAYGLRLPNDWNLKSYRLKLITLYWILRTCVWRLRFAITFCNVTAAQAPLGQLTQYFRSWCDTFECNYLLQLFYAWYLLDIHRLIRFNNRFQSWVEHTELTNYASSSGERIVLRMHTCYGVKNYLIDVYIIDKRKSVKAEST